MKYFFPRIRFLFLGVFIGAMAPSCSLDATMSCAASFILQKKGNPDTVIIEEHILINPISNHKMTMVFMLREYGGWQMADFLAENIRKTMQESFDKRSDKDNPKLFDAFPAAVNSINKKIKTSPDKNVHNTAATALITVFTGNDELWIANVGSCCAVVFGKKKEKSYVFGKKKEKSYLTFLNKPHVSKPLLGGVFPVSCVFGYPELLLGSSENTNYKDILAPKPDIVSYAIKKNDELLIIASYEVFDILSQKEVENICQNTSDPKGVCCAIKTAMQNALGKQNIAITSVALYVVNLPIQKKCDVLMGLNDIDSDFLDEVRKKVDNDNKKVVAMRTCFKNFESLLVSVGGCSMELVGDKVFAILKSWYYIVQLGQYTDSAMSQKLTKEIDRSFDHVLAAVQVSDIGIFLSNKQKEEISLWRSQFDPDYFN